MSVGVGLIGCGAVSRQYLANLVLFPDVRVLACADLQPQRAKAVAAELGVPESGEPDLVLGHPGVELVINLTPPVHHLEVSLAAVAAGKHVYSEKPLALDPADAARLRAAAAAAGVRVGAAPDTFLGAGLQSAYRLLAAGAIGEPQTALVLQRGPGPQLWHHDPEFLFRRGGGPLYDFGPYYLTALAAAFGPVARVAATARTALPEREILAGPRAGTRFAVEVPTYVAALLEFRGGLSATSVFSFDSPAPRDAVFEVTGTEAVLRVPNPNRFDGTLALRRPGEVDWSPVPTGGATGRGIGVLDMARALRTGAPHRAGAALAQHVVEVMSAVDRSAAGGGSVVTTGDAPVPAPLPPDWDPRERTL